MGFRGRHYPFRGPLCTTDAHGPQWALREPRDEKVYDLVSLSDIYFGALNENRRQRSVANDASVVADVAH